MSEASQQGSNRPMFPEQRPTQPIHAPRGSQRRCATWDAEAAMRMLMNNLDPQVAIDWESLIVYGGNGRAARNWACYQQIIAALQDLAPDETLCVQSGKPVYVARTHEYAPRVLIANSNLVPHWATQDEFDRLDALGLMMYGQMTAGSWIYIGTQGILQGTYETFASLARQEFDADSLKGRFVLTAGMGGMSGAQPLAGTMNEAAILIVEVRGERIARKVDEGYCDRMTTDLDEALSWIDEATGSETPLSVGLVGNAADVFPELASRSKVPDVVTDQTSAHDLLSYVPQGDLEDLDELRLADPAEYKRRSVATIMRHTQAILDLQRQGAVCFDYGNNLRGQAEAGASTCVTKRVPSAIPVSFRHTSGHCSALARGRFGGLACRETRRISRRSTMSYCEYFPTIGCCIVGCAWPVSGCRSSGCRREFAGSATGTGRSSAPLSTVWSATGRFRRRSPSAVTISIAGP